MSITTKSSVRSHWLSTRWLLLTVVAIASALVQASLSVRAASWVETVKLVGSDTEAFDNYGWSVSVSGATIFVGAPSEGEGFHPPGSAYIFEKSGTRWTQTTKLIGADTAPGDSFGYSVSVSGHTAVIGAVHDDDRGENSGSGYVFEKLEGQWTETAKLVASDGQQTDQFGIVSVSGDTVVVGTLSNSVYIFEKVEGVWRETMKLLAGNGSDTNAFGDSVNVYGNTIVVGAKYDDDGGHHSGAAYVFEKMGGVWIETAKLVALDPVMFDQFGGSVSISEEIVVVGASEADHGANNSGSCYVFEKVGDVWTETAKLVPSDATEGDYFGSFVSLSADTLLVGAPYHAMRYVSPYEGCDDCVGADLSGAAYVFKKVDGTWTETAKLISSHDTYEFGWIISLSASTAVVGAFPPRLVFPLNSDNNDIQSGAAYVFEFTEHFGVKTLFLLDGYGNVSTIQK